MRNLTASRKHFEKASRRMPLGVASNFRYWGDDKTIYIKEGKGGRVTDLDGNVYIDYRLGYGPCILGYADERVDEAARRGMRTGGVFALSIERELELADMIASMVPAAEMVRYSNSGTEAVMAALRLARAYSKRDAYIVVEGGYHGIFDSVLWSTDVKAWTPDQPKPPVVPFSEGVPELTKRLFHTVPLNDTNALEDLLREHGNSIGAFLIEPIMGNCCGLTADKQYLQDVRKLCDKYGIVLIVDEVKTGFRVARGGVQELFGIEADLCTFAKAIGNCYPISVLAGRRKIMQKIGDGVVHGGTFTAHPVSIEAAIKTVELLRDTEALETIRDYGVALRNGISEILNKRSVVHCFMGHPSLSGLVYSDKPPTNYRDWVNSNYTFYDAMAPELHEEGVMVEPDSREPWFMCEAHAVDCLDETLAKFELATDRTLAALAPEDRQQLTGS